MAWYVHIHVCFACDYNDGVAALAKEHLAGTDYQCREAKWFLESLSQRTGTNAGTKGGLSLWGICGNYTNGEEFVEELKPFWEDLLKSDTEGGPLYFEHILVFVEPEQSEQTIAYEIFLDEDLSYFPPTRGGDLVVKVHECPFCFYQM
jgi:hypothetical protein